VSQVLNSIKEITTAGINYDRTTGTDDPKALNLLGIVDFANHLLEGQKGVVDARGKIDEHLESLTLKGDNLKSRIEVGGSKEREEMRLRRVLEKLDLGLVDLGKPGLGSNSLLFIACELLLLAQEDERTKLLLLEEPEAHLHAQRQLRVMKFMQEILKSDENVVQVIISTHSPNLASAIELGNIVIVRKGRAFSLAHGQTELESSDYRFLQRFLDVTKANLFFARGVMIVEGDAENLLIPTLAKILGKDFTTHGVSIVNVGGVGLRRYARIFQRREIQRDDQLDVPVACITDMDVMPDCAPLILGKINEADDWPATSGRRWRAKKDIADLGAHRKAKRDKAMGQFVKTFVSDEWTLEYDLALGPTDSNGDFALGLAQDVYVAACLAERDDQLDTKLISGSPSQPSLLDESNVQAVVQAALTDFARIRTESQNTEGCSAEEVIACRIYAKFANGASKAIAAQHLADRLYSQFQSGELSADSLRVRLPKYLIDAIDYVTSESAQPQSISQGDV
jgi:putative ATP-dependent endonuclease of OLD family